MNARTASILSIVSAVGVYLVLERVPLPGVDPGFGPATLSQLLPMAALLLLAGFPRLLGREPGRGMALAWFAVVALYTWHHANILITAGPGVVPDIGLRFRLMLLASAWGAAAVVWGVAMWVDRVGAASGALLLYAVDQLPNLVARTYGAGADLAAGYGGWPALAPWLLVAVSFSCCIVVAARRPPDAGPLRALDLALLPVLGTAPLVVYGTFTLPWAGDVAPWITAASSLAAAAVAVIHARRFEPRRLPLLAAGLALLLPALALVPVAQAVIRGDRTLAQVVSGPLAGAAAGTTLLVSEGGDPATDGPQLVARLGKLGISATARTEGAKIRLQLTGAQDIDRAIAAIGPRWDFGIHPMAPDGTPLQSCRCGQDCRPMAVGPPAFSASALATAEVGMGQFGDAQVFLGLTTEASQAFFEFTRQHTGRLVAFVVDGDILMAPHVREPIPGGRVQIMLERCPDRDNLVHAEAMAAGLAFPTSAAWRPAP